LTQRDWLEQHGIELVPHHERYGRPRRLFSIWFINLTDYHAVRRGRYDVSALYELDGRYGRFNWTGCGVYVLGILVQIPFAMLSFHTGVLARVIGADVAWLPGSVIPAAVYWMVARKTCRDPTSR
jgi:purine-cytosine permease-like protein